MKLFSFIILILITGVINAQNLVYIPPAVTGTTFNLDIQNGTKQFYPGITTNTMGVNGNFMGPTLILNKGDVVSMNVTNSTPNDTTTLHWYGLHVPQDMIGGPYSKIFPGNTWSPTFEVNNWAATYFYRPLGIGNSQEQVSKGLCGFILVKDSVEANFILPRTYGVDDFPLMIQSRAFDAAGQIEVQSNMDSSITVNGTVNPLLNAPAQVVRLRLANTSSRRSYLLGFTGNLPFHAIAGDAGLLDSAAMLTRFLLAPGDRGEILVDLQGMTGQTIHLKNFPDEFTYSTIYGVDTFYYASFVQVVPDYNLNPLNVAEFNLMQINVVPPTMGAVTTIPTALVQNTAWPYPPTPFGDKTASISVDSVLIPYCQAMGPYSINYLHFDPGYTMFSTYLNKIEKWRINNQGGIAHTFHLQGTHFYIIGTQLNVPPYSAAREDNFLIPRGSWINIVVKFEDYGNDSIPYLFQSSLLRHEDQGLIQTIKVIDTTTSVELPEFVYRDNIWAWPNPARDKVSVQTDFANIREILIMDMMGKIIFRKEVETNMEVLDVSHYESGLYLVKVVTGNGSSTLKIIKE